ncbi:glycosyltransferase [Dysgonomonas sp. 216]|uniref:glycosyltransferase n=1 Tax=Dysgonomonas sp. 216 TaxID=2302934 RepID=UPI001C88BD27|nr:glycosyltransferase [Dysgonomonas sp. 216]
MPRYAQFLGNILSEKKHNVTYLTARPVFYKLPIPSFLKKWMGYIDQYVVFPISVKKKIKNYPDDTLFVFADHALGPWVPLASHRKHIIHCHDFLAQRSALDEIPENITSWTGKKYQSYIRRGYQKGKNFISISKKTQTDLHRFLLRKPDLSSVVYNCLNRQFTAIDVNEARLFIQSETKVDTSSGYILHVGGNQWYKNRKGVIEIYEAWRDISEISLPLILVGETPDMSLLEKKSQSRYSKDIYVVTDANDYFVDMAYSGASVFLFPSLEEGFGWPIIEAMNFGCPVITTGEPPMSEVGGDAAFYIDKRPQGNNEQINIWARKSAEVLNSVLDTCVEDKSLVMKKGYDNLKRFDAKKIADEIELIYKQVIMA